MEFRLYVKDVTEVILWFCSTLTFTITENRLRSLWEFNQIKGVSLVTLDTSQIMSQGQSGALVQNNDVQQILYVLTDSNDSQNSQFEQQQAYTTGQAPVYLQSNQQNVYLLQTGSQVITVVTR